MDMQFEGEPDVPDLIAALALRFARHGFAREDACIIAMEMLAEAMDDATEGAMLH